MPGGPTLALLAGLTPRAFLRRHWQKRPLLVRGAFPSFRDPITPAGLLRLAARESVESRLVLERGGRRPWQVVSGPLEPAQRRALGPSHWTVLVQNVDAHVESVAALLDPFSFLPRWRVDDVMVSLAAPRGSVGPHVDSYDVFLLQGRGRRRWRIARRFRDAYRPGLDLRVLRGFHGEEEWVLEPGDMLYLPPGVAHHGVALEECLTYSIGFRAPAERDLVAGYLQRVVIGADPVRRYVDPDLAPTDEPGEISAAAIGRLRAMVAQAARIDSAAFMRFAGEHLTQPRAEGGRPRRLSAAELRRALRARAAIVRARGARLGFIREGRGVRLFADGRQWPLTPVLAAAAPELTRERVLPPAFLRAWGGRPAFVALLADLVSAGVFRVRRRPLVSRGPRPGPAVAALPGRRGNRRAEGSGSKGPRR